MQQGQIANASLVWAEDGDMHDKDSDLEPEDELSGPVKWARPKWHVKVPSRPNFSITHPAG